jgi:hypothetical protein
LDTQTKIALKELQAKNKKKNLFTGELLKDLMQKVCDREKFTLRDKA